MKIEVERKALLKAVDAAVAVMERRNTIPILSNVYLSTDGQGLRVRGTDLDIETTELIAASVTREGITTISGSMLQDIVRKAPDGALISIDADGNNATVKSGRSRFQLGILPHDTYPALSRTSYAHTFQIGARALHRLLSKAKFAISTEETRYYLNGIYLHAVDAQLRAVATDGHRLAWLDMELPEGAEGMAGVIIPRKAVDLFIKAISGLGGDEVTVSVSDTKIRLETATGAIASKVIEGTFPDYTRVVPQLMPHLVSVDAGDLSKAIARVSSVLSERHNGVKAQISDDAIDLSAGSDGNTSADSVTAAYEGAQVTVGFNAKYVSEVLAQIGDLATLSIRGPSDAIVIRDADDAMALYLCMPLRV